MNTEQSIDKEALADALIESFRRDSLERPPDFGEECAMTAKAMAYALDEAEPQERSEIKKHLITCRACADLYFDVRMTEKWAEESSLQTVSMPAELQAAIEKRAAPASDSMFQRIASNVYGYLSFLTTRQRLASVTAGFAMVCCLAVLYIHFSSNPSIATITVTAEQMTVRDESTQTAAHPINPGDMLKADEKLNQITITTNKDVYGYVIIAYASGDVKTLYSGEFKADKAKLILGTEEQVKLDYHSGKNMIFLIAKDAPIPDFDKKIKESELLDKASIEKLFPDASLYDFGYERE
ncbi:hypothetical protein QUF90_13390 [Desulfococcaceae bacterium HSG9]|nr:hypothetical protein [Desulfococcaceae bacterium HSG9]